MLSLKSLHLNAMISVKNVTVHINMGVRQLYLLSLTFFKIARHWKNKIRSYAITSDQIRTSFITLCLPPMRLKQMMTFSAHYIRAHAREYSASIMGLSEQIKTFNYFGCSLSRRNSNYGHTVLQNIPEIFGTILYVNKTKILLKLSQIMAVRTPLYAYENWTQKKNSERRKYKS